MDSFLNKIYAFRFFDAFILIGILFVLLFSERGLQPDQISLLIAIWSITTLITEIPTGTLADKYSRRNLLIIGLLLRAVGFGFWIIGGFVNYAVGFVLWGLKNALTSGTLEAFVYDELNYYTKQSLYEEVSGKMTAYFSLGLTLSAIVGGLVADFNFTLVIIASIVSTLINVLILVTIKDVKQVQKASQERVIDQIALAINQVLVSKRLRSIMAFIIIIFSIFAALDEYWALIYQELHIPVSLIGLLIGINYAIAIVSGRTVKLFKAVNSSFLLALSAIAFLTLGFIQHPIGIFLAILGIYLYQIANIKLEASMQHVIKSHQRATISSLKSFAFEIVYVFAVLALGYIGTQQNILSLLVIVGVAILAITSIRFLWFSTYSSAHAIED